MVLLSNIYLKINIISRKFILIFFINFLSKKYAYLSTVQPPLHHASMMNLPPKSFNSSPNSSRPSEKLASSIIIKSLTQLKISVTPSTLLSVNVQIITLNSKHSETSSASQLTVIIQLSKRRLKPMLLLISSVSKAHAEISKTNGTRVTTMMPENQPANQVMKLLETAIQQPLERID